MLKNYQIKTLLVVCLMTIFGGMSAWGATNTYTYTFSSNPFDTSNKYVECRQWFFSDQNT